MISALASKMGQNLDPNYYDNVHFLLISEARVEKIVTILSLFFGRIEAKRNCFWDFLTLLKKDRNDKYYKNFHIESLF